MKKEKIITTDNDELEVDHFIAFGYDNKYIAVAGDNVYRKIETSEKEIKYELLENDSKKKMQ